MLRAVRRRAATRPAREILRLLDAAIFNLIIGNADAHAKNFSLLHNDGTIVLAPLYDLLSTMIYPGICHVPKLAMKIGGKAVLKKTSSRATGTRLLPMPSSARPSCERGFGQLCEVVTTALDSEFTGPAWAADGFVPVIALVRERAGLLDGKL